MAIPIPQDTPDFPAGFGDVNGKSPIYGIAGDYSFSGDDDDFLHFAHDPVLQIANGTYAMNFNATSVEGMHALFSKDRYGDGDGHLLAYIEGGKLKVRLQTDSSEEYIILQDNIIIPGQDYHFALTFGENGFSAYLNGKLIGAEPTFKMGMETNTETLIVGANGWARSDANPNNVIGEFAGTISDFAVYDEQLSTAEVITLAGPDLAHEAMHEEALLDLMPAFSQLHHASDYLKNKADDLGFGHDDHHMLMMKHVHSGDDANNALNGDGEGNWIDGKMGHDTVNGNGGNDALQGGYGNDDLHGGAGDDVLDGGHGEDVLVGGEGNDFLISQVDGREGFITYDPDRDEGDPYNELDPVTGKLYADQPIPADDVLTGGAGADTFYFQSLINAKERYIEKHTNDDGTVRWHGVAGENDKLHDHWVDVFGNDVITDFNRAEGDKIVVEGHTTEILKVTHGDGNGDGIIDHSLIHVYSNQGAGGGAHNKDLLGTIKVYGDLIHESDITNTAAPAYGIVKYIDRLDEAITPLENGVVRADKPGPNFDPAGEFGVINGIAPVYGLKGAQSFSDSDDYFDLAHTAALQLPAGTYAMHFNASNIAGMRTLFSKDAYEYKDGGHLTAYLQDGKLTVRLQSDSDQKVITYHDALILPGQDHHLAVSFGAEGFKVFLNGALAGQYQGFTQGMEANTESLIVGGNGWARKDYFKPDATDAFKGTITDFTVYGEQLSAANILQLATGEAGDEDEGDDGGVLDGDLVLTGTGGADVLDGGNGNDEIKGLNGNDTLSGNKGNDTLVGAGGKDELNGGDGNDLLKGGGGNDTVNGDGGDDKLYGNAGNDLLLGGDGKDNLFGGQGNDEVDGGAANDVIQGNLGSDTLTGGAGKDKFVYKQVADSNMSDADLITDFVQGDDKLNVKALGFDNVSDFTIATAGGVTSVEDVVSGFKVDLAGSFALTNDDFIF